MHSFPDWFDFGTSKLAAHKAIGNSVPPLLAYAIAQALTSQFAFQVWSHLLSIAAPVSSVSGEDAEASTDTVRALQCSFPYYFTEKGSRQSAVGRSSFGLPTNQQPLMYRHLLHLQILEKSGVQWEFFTQRYNHKESFFYTIISQIPLSPGFLPTREPPNSPERVRPVLSKLREAIAARELERSAKTLYRPLHCVTSVLDYNSSIVTNPPSVN